MTLELYFSQQLEEALTVQYERIKDRRVRDTFVKRLENQIETLLKDCIDWDLKEPTEAHGSCQASCPLLHAAIGRVLADAGSTLSGFSQTAPTGCQLRTARPRQRSGWRCLAAW